MSGYHLYLNSDELPQVNIKITTKEQIKEHKKIQMFDSLLKAKNLETLKAIYNFTLFNSGLFKDDGHNLEELINQSFLQRCYLDTVTALHFYDITVSGLNTAKDI